MGKRETNAARVIALAYFHRYGWIALTTVCILHWPERFCEILGGFFVIHGIWSLAGYRRKWKHVYCSNQNASRQKMTPNSVRWDTMKKSDAYGLPALCLIFGIVYLFIGWRFGN